MGCLRAALSEYATVVRSVWGSDDWRSKLYSKKISQWMEDPSRTYKSIARDPRVSPFPRHVLAAPQAASESAS